MARCAWHLSPTRQRSLCGAQSHGTRFARHRERPAVACDSAILPETSAGRRLSGHPRARGRAVSKSHRRRMKNVEAVEFESLFHRFKDEYGTDSVRLVEQLRERYPEITKRGRRTGRSLRN